MNPPCAQAVSTCGLREPPEETVRHERGRGWEPGGGWEEAVIRSAQELCLQLHLESDVAGPPRVSAFVFFKHNPNA